MTSNFLRWLPLAGLLALIAVAVPAAAEYYEGKPECPEGMMCTMSESTEGGEPIPYGPEDCIECSGPSDGGAGDGAAGDGSKEPDGRGPADCEFCRGEDNATDGPSYDQDCGGEVCAYDGPDTPVDNGSCMDGTAQDCRDDVQYLDGSGSSGAPSGAEPGKAGGQESASAGNRAVPGAPLLVGVLALAGVAAMVAFGRKSR